MAIKQKVSVPAPNEVSVERLERSTNGLKGHCSAIELHARFAKNILSRASLFHKP
jgi:hypothetical protein